jgi:hypothetical protein
MGQRLDQFRAAAAECVEAAGKITDPCSGKAAILELFLIYREPPLACAPSAPDPVPWVHCSVDLMGQDLHFASVPLHAMEPFKSSALCVLPVSGFHIGALT